MSTLALGAVVPPSASGAQATAPRATFRLPDFGGEGPLGVGSFQPVAREAAERVARGDRELIEREDGDALPIAAFEAWFAALDASAPGDALPLVDEGEAALSAWLDVDESFRRRSEGVGWGVRRRLAAIGAAQRERWSERFEGAAAVALDLAGRDEAALARVEWLHPATPSGARAALRLADLALERGALGDARTWLGRADFYPSGRLAAAIDARRRVVARLAVREVPFGDSSLRTGTTGVARAHSTSAGSASSSSAERNPDGSREAGAEANATGDANANGALESTRAVNTSGPPGGPPAERSAGSPNASRAIGVTWRDASLLAPSAAHVISGALRRSPQRTTVGRGVESGLCPLPDGSMLVQGPTVLARWLPPELRSESTPPMGRFSQGDFVDGRINRPFSVPAGGGWPLLPTSDAQGALIVVGRALGGSTGNALVSLRLEDPGVPVTRWSLSSDGWAREGEAPRPLADALGKEGTWEWQPGPVLADGRVFALARRVSNPRGGEAEDGSEELWLFAFDARDGSPLWSRYVTKPADLRRDRGGRASTVGEIPTSAEPLAWIDGEDGPRLFVGTGVGLGELVDALDGRLVWSFACRRRDAEANGWPGSRPAQTLRLEGELALAWAPFDSDQLYTLRAGPVLGEGLGPFDPAAWRARAGRDPARLRAIFASSLQLRAPRPIESALALVEAASDATLVQARWGARQSLVAWPEDGEPFASIHLGEDEEFTGRPLVSETRVYVASDRFLYLFDRGRELELIAAHPLEVPADAGGGPPPLGGSVFATGGRVFVVGLDAFWVFDVVE